MTIPPTDHLRLERALAAIDAVHAQDPRHTQDETGQPVPYELLYARRLSDTLAEFAPEASETLQLALRAQHLERWSIPRESYPMDRSGYLNWRSDLKQLHAERAGTLLQAEGYDDATVARVAALIRKERLKSDAECQTLEDVVCLVFLKHYLAEFAHEHDEEKVAAILAKTWRKMSAAGHAAALALPFTAEQQALLAKALPA